MKNFKINPPQSIQKSKSPKEIFNELGFPVVVIEGVIKENTKNFLYNGENFSRVELIAKKYYEQHGCLVSWSEGVAFDFLRKATSMYICSKLCEAYKYHSNILTNPRSKRFSWAINGNSPIEPVNLMQLTTYLRDHAYHDLTNILLPAPTIGQAAYFDSIIAPNPLFELIVDKNCLVEIYLQAKNDLYNNAQSVLTPLVKDVVSDYIATGQDKYNGGPYFFEFCIELLKQGGYGNYFNEFEVNDVPGTVFDLMVWNGVEKSMKFIEVKNKDKFTESQFNAISRYLVSPVVPLELCLVQTH